MCYGPTSSAKHNHETWKDAIKCYSLQGIYYIIGVPCAIIGGTLILPYTCTKFQSANLFWTWFMSIKIVATKIADILYNI